MVVIIANIYWQITALLFQRFILTAKKGNMQISSSGRENLKGHNLANDDISAGQMESTSPALVWGTGPPKNADTERKLGFLMLSFEC